MRIKNKIINKVNVQVKDRLWEEVKLAVAKCNQKEFEYLQAEKEFQEVYKLYKESLLYIEE